MLTTTSERQTPSVTSSLPTGVYDQLLTEALLARLDDARIVRMPVENAESADALAHHLGRLMSYHLTAMPSEARVGEANRLLAAISQTDVITPGPEHLLAVAEQEAPGIWRLLQIRPQVPLSRPALLTNSNDDPKLGVGRRVW